MTALGWLALGVAAALLGRPAGGRRTDGLAAVGRLAGEVPGGAGVTAGAAQPVSRRRWRGSPEASRRRALRAALAALADELTAGGRPGAALAAAAAASSDPAYAAVFDRASAAAAHGGDVVEVLRDDPTTAALAGAWNLADRAGAPLAAVIERVAADLDAVEEQRRAVAVALAGPRSSAAVLAGLPALGLLLGTTMGGRPLPFLVGSPAGVAVGAAGIALDLTGLWWMHRILRWASR